MCCKTLERIKKQPATGEKESDGEREFDFSQPQCWEQVHFFLQMHYHSHKDRLFYYVGLLITFQWQHGGDLLATYYTHVAGVVYSWACDDFWPPPWTLACSHPHPVIFDSLRYQEKQLRVCNWRGKCDRGVGGTHKQMSAGDCHQGIRRVRPLPFSEHSLRVTTQTVGRAWRKAMDASLETKSPPRHVQSCFRRRLSGCFECQE